MDTLSDRIHRILQRRPFAVLGYSAEDETYCPTCLRLTTGLSPNGTDTYGKPILALYLRDPHVHEECCSTCQQKLIDLVPGMDPAQVLEIRQRIPVPNSTVIKYETVGRLTIYSDGRGTLVTNLADDGTFNVFETAEEHMPPTPERIVTARPPTVRHHAATH